METEGNEIHIDRNEARAGSTPGVVRYILAISLALVVIAFAIIVMTGALNSNQDNNRQDDSQRALAEQQHKPQQ
jgi:hypothetical protein